MTVQGQNRKVAGKHRRIAAWMRRQAGPLTLWWRSKRGSQDRRWASTRDQLTADMEVRGEDTEAEPQALPSALPEWVIMVLGRPGWFDPTLLGTVRLKLVNLFVRVIQRMAGVPVAATTIGDTIYFREPKFFDPESPAGLALLAHELRHVEQWREQGFVQFSIRYALEFLRHGGYGPNISFEADACEVQRTAQEHLEEEFAHNDDESPCLITPAGHAPNPQYSLLRPYPDLPRGT